VRIVRSTPLLRLWLLVVMALVSMAAPAWAQKTVHVGGYTRRDGTYVRPHDRRAPGTATGAAPSSRAKSPAAAAPVYEDEPDKPSVPAPTRHTKTAAWAAGVAGATFVQTSPHYSTATGYLPPRDSHGRIRRSASARHEFLTLTGYPQGRRGYVVDHIIPLACGGADDPSNMQWQTVEAAHIKDRTERIGCGTKR
jgi:hypothetical protein